MIKAYFLLAAAVLYTILLVAIISVMGCGGVQDGIDGKSGLTGNNGLVGEDGQDGKDGKDGQDGSSCSVQTVLPSLAAPDGGALLTCGLTSTLILNGAPGSDGLPGAVSPYALVEIINPCGDTAGIYDEVLLRLYNGQLIASFSDKANGQNTRLSLIPPGNYVTTDGSDCHFNVAADLSVTW